MGSDMIRSRSERPVIALNRRTIDIVLVALGGVVTVVLLIAGGLLTWGSDFAGDYVERELTAQNIRFPDGDAFTSERPDLAEHAGEQVTDGEDAEAYASYIAGHVEDIGGGLTYAELGGPEREARAAVQEAQAVGASADEIADLQAAAEEITAQRDTIFRGEVLRGTLLNTYAWSTIGQIAGIAAMAAFVAAGVMLVLVVLGVVHLRRQ